MKIDTRIVDAYLNGEDVRKFAPSWLYVDCTKDSKENFFHTPPEIGMKREAILRIKAEIMSHAKNFVPCNAPIWDALFADWRMFMEDTAFDLIVGYPDTNDAVVKRAPDGKIHMIFDLLCWEKYLDVIPLAALAQNLLTHELFHVLVGNCFPEIESVEAHGMYLDQLDAIAFNEGFAHLVSYNQQEIDAVAWNGEKLSEVYDSSVAKMKAALKEKHPEKQSRYVYEASYGNYYDKYAAMCGMIYLGQQWQKDGISRLTELFRQGYHGFAGKSMGL